MDKVCYSQAHSTGSNLFKTLIYILNFIPSLSRSTKEINSVIMGSDYRFASDCAFRFTTFKFLIKIQSKHSLVLSPPTVCDSTTKNHIWIPTGEKLFFKCRGSINFYVILFLKKHIFFDFKRKHFGYFLIFCSFYPVKFDSCIKRGIKVDVHSQHITTNNFFFLVIKQ